MTIKDAYVRNGWGDISSVKISGIVVVEGGMNSSPTPHYVFDHGDRLEYQSVSDDDYIMGTDDAAHYRAAKAKADASGDDKSR